MAEKVQSPHDALVKSIFSSPEHAVGVLRTALPAEIAGRLDWDSLELVPGDFVDDNLREHLTDLLYSVQLGGEAALVYLLFEHQSTVHRWMLVRLWRYVGEIWQSYIDDHPDATRLPVIIPVVLHHSATGWTSATELRELFGLSPDDMAALDGYVPALRFVLDDLSQQQDDDLRARAMTALAFLVLWTLKHARRNPDFLSAMRSIMDVLVEVLLAPTGRGALSRVFRYILQVTEVDPGEFHEVLIQSAQIESSEAFMTGAEILRQEGRKQGREQGRKQGREQGRKQGRKQGRLEALRSVATGLLEQRFETLPPWARRKIARAREDSLQRWIAGVLDAESLEDVLAGPPRGK